MGLVTEAERDAGDTVLLLPDRLTLPARPFVKRLHYLLTLSDTFTGWVLSQLQGNSRCDEVAAVLLGQLGLDLACHFPKLLGHGCWYHLSRLKGISALSPGSFILASSVQPGHISVGQVLIIFFFSC